MPVIRIHTHSFIISAPYSSGSRQIGPAELAALDRLRAENIRNNAAKRLDKSGQKWPLPPQALEDFAHEIASLDATYEFPAPERLHSRPGAFSRLVEAIAQERAFEQLQGQGYLQPSQDEVRALAEELSSTPEVQAEARRRLAVQSQTALKVLEELL